MADASVDTETKTKAPAYLVPPVIAKALISIQKELEPLTKSSENDAFGSKYVPLDVVTEKAHKLLAEKKIAVMQPMVTDDQGHAALETILIYEDGRSFSRTTKLAMNKVDPQAHGSAVTYTRRYALMSMIGLTAKDEDDDGNRATGVHVPVTEEQKNEVKMLLTLLKWPHKQILNAVFALKTKDAADLAIDKYRTQAAESKRELESKETTAELEKELASNANPDRSKKVDVKDAEAEPPIGEVHPRSFNGFQRRFDDLKLASKTYQNKIIVDATKAPWLEKVMEKAERVEALDNYLKLLESGVKKLPAEYYAPSKENIVVEEPVA